MDICFGAYAHGRRSLKRSCPGAFYNMPDSNMPFVCHAAKVEYVHRMPKILCTDISFERNIET